MALYKYAYYYYYYYSDIYTYLQLKSRFCVLNTKMLTDKLP